MLEPSQIVIITAASIMTVLLIIIGVQLILILRDVQRLLSRASTLMGQFEKIGVGVTTGYGELITFVGGISKLFQILDIVGKRKRAKNDK